MFTAYVGLTIALAIMLMICAIGAAMEYTDAATYEKQHWARWSLTWLAGIFLAPLWPVILPLAIIYGMLVMYRDAFPREED